MRQIILKDDGNIKDSEQNECTAIYIVCSSCEKEVDLINFKDAKCKHCGMPLITKFKGEDNETNNIKR